MKKIKDPGESVVLEFDFSSELSAIDSVALTATIYGDGTDPALGTFFDGASQISGKKVFQRISAGVRGIAYKVKAIGTHGSDKIARRDIIYVEEL